MVAFNAFNQRRELPNWYLAPHSDSNGETIERHLCGTVCVEQTRRVEDYDAQRAEPTIGIFKKLQYGAGSINLRKTKYKGPLFFLFWKE